jgi:hypothetical protein
VAARKIADSQQPALLKPRKCYLDNFSPNMTIPYCWPSGCPRRRPSAGIKQFADASRQGLRSIATSDVRFSPPGRSDCDKTD